MVINSFPTDSRAYPVFDLFTAHSQIQAERGKRDDFYTRVELLIGERMYTSDLEKARESENTENTSSDDHGAYPPVLRSNLNTLFLIIRGLP